MLLTFLDILTILISTYYLAKSFINIFRGLSNIMNYCTIAFYFIQVLPLFVKIFLGIAPTVSSHINVYNAMSDKMTCMIYDIMVLFSMIMLTYLSNRLRYKKRIQATYSDNNKPLSENGAFSVPVFLRFQLNGNVYFFANIILVILMIAPAFTILFSPDPKIYLNFSYFITHPYSSNDSIYEFHNTIVRTSLYISVLAIWLQYIIKKKNSSLYTYIAIGINTWVDGKRTIFVLLLVGLLVIDLLKGKYYFNKNKQVLKTCIFGIIIVLYFIYYNTLTGKGSSYVFNHLYTFYFSRMSIVETTIYDKLYTNKMLDYPGQSILFNILAWIPRSIWEEKPVMFTFYFTRYAQDSIKFQPFNLMVNIWSEFVANFGIVGPFLACLFLYWIAKTSEKSNSKIVYVLGAAFSVMYSVYGFEHIIMRMFYIWLALVLISYARRKFTIGASCIL